MRHLTVASLALAVSAVAAPAFAAPIDGSFDPSYGALNGPALRAVQTVGTQFGNSTLGDPKFANGSELNAAYAYIDPATNVLTLLLTGNLETNFNKLNVFIQAGPGGANTVPNVGGAFGAMTGMKLDTAFSPNVILSVTAGGSNPDVFVDAAVLNGAGAQGYIGQTTIGGSTSLSGGSASVGGVTLSSLLLGINNSNAGGVGSFGSPVDPVAAGLVSTGIELSIDLDDLGFVGGDVLIAAAINGGGNDFYSNQFLGGLPDGTGNLGGPGGVDLSALAGNQFFSVAVPEPTVLGLLAPVGLVALRRRR